MKKKWKRWTRIGAVALTGIVTAGLVIGSLSHNTEAASKMYGVQQVVDSITAEDPFTVVEIVPDKIYSSIGFYQDLEVQSIDGKFLRNCTPATGETLTDARRSRVQTILEALTDYASYDSSDIYTERLYRLQEEKISSVSMLSEGTGSGSYSEERTGRYVSISTLGLNTGDYSNTPIIDLGQNAILREDCTAVDFNLNVLNYREVSGTAAVGNIYAFYGDAEGNPTSAAAAGTLDVTVIDPLTYSTEEVTDYEYSFTPDPVADAGTTIVVYAVVTVTEGSGEDEVTHLYQSGKTVITTDEAGRILTCDTYLRGDDLNVDDYFFVPGDGDYAWVDYTDEDTVQTELYGVPYTAEVIFDTLYFRVSLTGRPVIAEAVLELDTAEEDAEEASRKENIRTLTMTPSEFSDAIMSGEMLLNDVDLLYLSGSSLLGDLKTFEQNVLGLTEGTVTNGIASYFDQDDSNVYINDIPVTVKEQILEFVTVSSLPVIVDNSLRNTGAAGNQLAELADSLYEGTIGSRGAVKGSVYVCTGSVVKKDLTTPFIRKDTKKDQYQTPSGTATANTFLTGLDAVVSELDTDNTYNKSSGAAAVTEIQDNMIRVSDATALKYILNYADRRVVLYKDVLNVLDLEPGAYSKLSTDAVRKWVAAQGSEEYERIEVVNITQMSTSEFVAKVEDLIENYDLIYIGSGRGAAYSRTDSRTDQIYAAVGSDMNTSNRTDWFIQGLMDANEYTATANVSDGTLLGKKEVGTLTTTYSGNDISEVKYNDLMEYVEAGHPIVVSSDLLTASGPTRNVDDSSWMYKLLKASVENYSREVSEEEYIEGGEGYYTTQYEVMDHDAYYQIGDLISDPNNIKARDASGQQIFYLLNNKAKAKKNETDASGSYDTDTYLYAENWLNNDTDSDLLLGSKTFEYDTIYYKDLDAVVYLWGYEDGKGFYTPGLDLQNISKDGSVYSVCNKKYLGYRERAGKENWLTSTNINSSMINLAGTGVLLPQIVSLHDTTALTICQTVTGTTAVNSLGSGGTFSAWAAINYPLRLQVENTGWYVYPVTYVPEAYSMRTAYMKSGEKLKNILVEESGILPNLVKYVNVPRLNLLIIDQPVTYQEQYVNNDKQSGVLDPDRIHGIEMINGERTLKYDFEFTNPMEASDAATYEVHLYIDMNADGSYVKTEELSGLEIIEVDTGNAVAQDDLRSGVRYRMQRNLPQGYLGMIPWKLAVNMKVAEGKTVIRSSRIGYTYASPTEEENITVKVLQILPSRYSLPANDTSTALEGTTNGKTVYLNDLLDGAEELLGITFEFTNMYIWDAPALKSGDTTLSNSISSYGMKNGKQDGAKYYEEFLNSYDMIVFGTADSFDKADPEYKGNEAFYEGLSTYITSGKPVLLTHDMISWNNSETERYYTTWFGLGLQWNFNQNYKTNTNTGLPYYTTMYLRSVMGMDRYGITTERSEGGGLWRMLRYMVMDYDVDSVRGLRGKVQDTSKDLASLDSVRAQAGTDTRYLAQGFTNVFLDTVGTTNDHATDGFLSTKISQINDGQITHYPYTIDMNAIASEMNDNVSAGNVDDYATTYRVSSGSYFQEKTIKGSVGETHAQYYQLDFNYNLSNSDMVVWFAMAGDEGTAHVGDSILDYDDVPNDARNNYYIYSVGNLTYTGMGNSLRNRTGQGNHLSIEEAKLYVNTLVAAFKNGIRKPSINIFGDSMNTTRDVIYRSVDQDAVNYNDGETVYGAEDEYFNVYIKDTNIFDGDTYITTWAYLETTEAEYNSYKNLSDLEKDARDIHITTADQSGSGNRTFRMPLYSMTVADGETVYLKAVPESELVVDPNNESTRFNVFRSFTATIPNNTPVQMQVNGEWIDNSLANSATGVQRLFIGARSHLVYTKGGMDSTDVSFGKITFKTRSLMNLD